MRTFDIVNREFDRLMIWTLKLHVRMLGDREHEHVDEHGRELERLLAEIRQWGARLGLSHITAQLG